MNQDRKKFLKQLSVGLMTATIVGKTSAMSKSDSIIDNNDFSGEGAPDDEKFWKRIAKKYYDIFIITIFK